MSIVVRFVLLLVALWLVAGASSECRAGRFSFLERTSMKLDVSDPQGVVEDAIPIYHDGELIHGHNHKVVEAFYRVPGTDSTPAVLADLVSNTFYRPTYLKEDGTGGTFGTSLISAPSFRTNSRFFLVPDVSRADVDVRRGVYGSELAYSFGDRAAGTASRSLEPPDGPRTTVHVSADFEAQRNIFLSTDARHERSDRMRMLTVSSMFSDNDEYDANLIRYESKSGFVRELRIDENTDRGDHLFSRALEVGSFIEIVKEPGSIWTPDSPSIRIDLPESNNLRLGLQGFLDESKLTSDDSLSVWLEWLDAPDVIAEGTALSMEYSVTAFAPGSVAIPEPHSHVLLVGMLLLLTSRRRRCSEHASISSRGTSE